MVLDHVADRADLFVKSAPALHTEILRHRDLNAFDVGPVPEGFEDGIGEAKKQHAVHRLFAQVMVNAINRLLLEGSEQDLIESTGGWQIATEGFFDDHP